MRPPPFTLTVYDGQFGRRGWIGDPLSVTATVRHNAISSCSVEVDADHPRVPDLMASGARLAVDYDGRHLLSGPIVSREGKGPATTATITVRADDDLRALWRVLAWPNPTGAITAQGEASSYDRVTGPAETAIKHYASRNFARLALPIRVAPDQGRGGRVALQARMHPIADRVFPAVDLAGVGVTIRHDRAVGDLVMDCYTPRKLRRLISEETGALVDWSWSDKSPTLTRTVVGGQGEGTAREFVLVVDAARETEWADVGEEFRDARDVGGDDTGADGEPEPADPAVVAETLTARGQERIEEGAATAGLTLTLAEAEGFRYGEHVRVGDEVTVQVAPGLEVTDVLREVQLSWTTEQGVEVTPIVGDRQDDPDVALRRAVNDIARALRALRTT